MPNRKLHKQHNETDKKLTNKVCVANTFKPTQIHHKTPTAIQITNRTCQRKTQGSICKTMTATKTYKHNTKTEMVRAIPVATPCTQNIHINTHAIIRQKKSRIKSLGCLQSGAVVARPPQALKSRQRPNFVILEA